MPRESGKAPEGRARTGSKNGIPARAALAVMALLWSHAALGQIQMELKFPRLQFISYEPIYATMGITTLTGRDIELQDADGRGWFVFDVPGAEGQLIPPTGPSSQPPLR